MDSWTTGGQWLCSCQVAFADINIDKSRSVYYSSDCPVHWEERDSGTEVLRMPDQFVDSFKYCRHCGGSLTTVSANPVRLVCGSCRKPTYLNPKVGVALLISDGDKVLLVRRAQEPLKDWWQLPAGYVEYEETCEETAYREAREELSTSVTLRALHGVYSYGDDPRSRIVLVVYTAACDTASIKAADDAAECRFFPVRNLPQNIAFHGIRQALHDWVMFRSKK